MKHILRFASIPLAMTAFLIAAQSAGNFTMREPSHIQIASR